MTPLNRSMLPAPSTLTNLFTAAAITVIASVTVNNQTAKFTGSMSGTTTMTVSAVPGAALAPGQNVTLGSFSGTIVSQLTGTTGSNGTYQMSGSATVSSTTGTASGSDQFAISVDPTNSGDAASQYYYGSFGGVAGHQIDPNETFVATIGITVPVGAVVRCWSLNGTSNFNLTGATP